MLGPGSSFEELMRSGYEEVGLAGSPFRLPVWLRRLTAGAVGRIPMAMSLVLWTLHHSWAQGGRWQTNEIARHWCQGAAEFTLANGREVGRALREMDRLPLFRQGCRELGFRDCAEAWFYRSNYLDAFFQSGPWASGQVTDPQQRPHYFVPGIPARRYYEASEFGWSKRLQSQFEVIREELLAVLREDSQGFGNYRGEYGNLSPGWNAFHFYIQGQPVEANLKRCPRTARILDSLEGLEKNFIFFSALNPKSRILPHVGVLNGILRFHLPLLVPEDCGIRVGGVTAEWREGQVLVFDDSFVHEVWNNSDQLRVVLFLNAWHPCLSPPEVAALDHLHRVCDRFPFGKRWKEAQQKLPPATVHYEART